MALALQILYIGDSGAVAVHAELTRGGYAPTFHHVTSEAHFLQALATHFDIAISDFVVEDFGALAALRIVQDRGVDLPLIVVSGKNDEAGLQAALKAGAADHLSRRNLTRLNAAVERELRAARMR